MNEVEKYGLFAVVFIGGLLVLIGLQSDWFEGDDGVAAADAAVEAPGASPVVIQVPEATRKKRPPTDVPLVKRIRPLTDDKPAFDWNEKPISYPGSPVSPALAAGDPPTSSAPPRTHVVGKGDTLSSIAKTYLGAESKWRELARLNPKLNPHRLDVGDVLVVRGDPAPPPSKPSPPPAKVAEAPAGPRTHVVKSGETLGAIAQATLGSVKHTQKLYEANRDVLSSPDRLEVGQVLRIP